MDNTIKKAKSTLLVCIVFVFVFDTNVKGQIGIKIGPTVSNFYYTSANLTPYQDFDIDLRPYLGYDVELVQIGDQKPLFSTGLSVHYSIHLTKRLRLRPELGFHQKGVNFSRIDFERIIYKVRISYVEVPLLVTYRISQKEQASSECYFGGYVARKINAVKRVTAHNASIKRTKLRSVKDFEGGVHLGLSHRHAYFGKVFLIDMRVFIGLSDIFEMPDDWIAIYQTIQHTKITGINLSVGYERSYGHRRLDTRMSILKRKLRMKPYIT